MLLAVVSAVWVGSEIVLGIVRHSRSGESVRRDRFSIAVLWICIAGAATGGSMLRAVRAAKMPGGATTFFIGIALIMIGIAIRWTAIFTLRRYFTVDVSIRTDHQVIQHGIYRVIRHPAYAGSLVSFIGLGIAFMNWISLAVMVLGTLIGFSYRISIEERELIAALGDDYRRYAARTKRLIPGVF
ncbi:MAG TPA: isoprenylcysteine carboxylmethyltransferase family protein [Thermoanaerobaculia bacterium]